MDSLRKYINIVEGRDAPLYHGIGQEKLRDTLNSNTLKGTWTHDIPGMGKKTGVSLTRNKNVKYRYVVFAFDQSKLAQNFKMIPVDGDRLYYRPDDVSGRSPEVATKNLGLSEEFLIGDITNLNKYLLGIQLVEPTHGDELYHDEQLLGVLKTLNVYSKQYNIPVEISPGLQRQWKKLKAAAAKQNSNKKTTTNKYMIIDITDDAKVKLLLLKDDSELSIYKNALSTGKQNSLYTKTITKDYIIFDDWDGGELRFIANRIYMLPLTKNNRALWSEQFDDITPEEYMADPSIN